MINYTVTLNNKNKEKSYKEQATESSRGKKRYIERIAEEREAEKLIKEYEKEEEREIDPEPINYKP